MIMIYDGTKGEETLSLKVCVENKEDKNNFLQRKETVKQERV